MSKKHRHHPQEKPMEAPTDTALSPAPEAPPVAEAPSPTAKEMAKAEEENQARLRALAEQNERESQPKPEEPTLIGLAAQGMDVLHDAIRKHSMQPTHPEYVPPPRTERQMTALQEELEAGRKTQQRAQAQANENAKARAAQLAADKAKEGFTNPVHRPSNLVPDPTRAAPGGAVAGTRLFGPDAP